MVVGPMGLWVMGVMNLAFFFFFFLVVVAGGSGHHGFDGLIFLFIFAVGEREMKNKK